MTDVFLGGTCNGSTWREAIKPMLDERGITYFDPVVPDWDEEAAKREVHERVTATVCLYVLTPKSDSPYSIAEIVDDSNKRPEKTVFCWLEYDDGDDFTHHQRKALSKIAGMVHLNGATVAEDLEHVADICSMITLARMAAA